VSKVTAIRVLPLTAVAAGVLALATGGSAAPLVPCTGGMLSGTFAAIPGSAGAGNIVYALKLRNRSPHPCFVSGLAGLRLLGRTGRPLPTKVEPAFRGALTAVRVVLNPGGVAKATARFTPDVPGPGEPTDRPCEPIAYKVRVTPHPGGGDLVLAVRPPTRVCVHGRISLSALSPT
jgi:Protein of unknown function (DUF4232)